MDSSQHDLLLEEADILFQKGAIEHAPRHYSSHRFYPPSFLILKKGGGFHPILDVWMLNCSIHMFHFQMGHLSSPWSLVCGS